MTAMGLLVFVHSSMLFSLAFPFGSVKVLVKSLVSFLSFSFTATNSLLDKSGVEFDVLTDDSLVVVVI